MRIGLRAWNISCTSGVLHDNADLALIEPGLVKLSDGLIGVSFVFKHADDCGTLLSIHVRLMQQI